MSATEPTEPTVSAVLPTASGRASLAAVRRLLRPRRRLVPLAVALFVARAAIGLAGPLLLGIIVDRVLDGGTTSSVTGPALLLIGAGVVEGLLALAAPIVGSLVTEPALADLREEVVERALDLPLDVVERAGVGDLVARVDGDVGVVTEGVRSAAPELLAAGLTIVLTAFGIAVLDWRLALAALLAVPIQLYTLRWYLPRSNPVYTAERVAAGARTEQLLETVSGAATVRAFDLAEHHTRLVADRSQRALDLVVAAVRLRTRFFARLNVAEIVGLGAILVTGFLLVDRGTATVGAVTSAVLYFHRLFDPVNVLLYLVDEVQSAGAAMARLVGVAQLPPSPVPTAATDAPATVRVGGVTHAYDAGHDVLHDVDLHIAAGERVAVVGASGAGKSTLAKLVGAVQHPDRGEVRVGGVRVDDLASVGRRLPVAVVTQEVHVFAGTLADDLRLVAPGASEDDVRRALELVGAWSWVRVLPDGLATVVGDGGQSLDPTQSQQVALARLVLADPAVAVLDEATAEAGSAGARVLEAAAAAALEGRTAIVIAHRLTQAATADRVVVLDHGRVVEEGPHAELVAAGGRYAQLWQAWAGPR